MTEQEQNSDQRTLAERIRMRHPSGVACTHAYLDGAIKCAEAACGAIYAPIDGNAWVLTNEADAMALEALGGMIYRTGMSLKLAREQAIFRLRTLLDAKAGDEAISAAWHNVEQLYDYQYGYSEALLDLHRAIVLHTLSGDQ